MWGKWTHGVFGSSWGVQTCRFFFEIMPRHHAQVHLAQMKDKQKVTGFVSPFAMLLGGGFKYDILYVHPYLGKINPI